MLDFLRTWMIGVTSAALIAGILSAITPDGTVKKVSRLAAGMLMAVAVLRPIKEISLEDISDFKIQYEAELNDYKNTVGAADEKFMNIIIADRTASYILERARQLDINCTVTVTTKKDAQGRIPLSVFRGNCLPKRTGHGKEKTIANSDRNRVRHSCPASNLDDG